jgi:hypothetical protein
MSLADVVVQRLVATARPHRQPHRRRVVLAVATAVAVDLALAARGDNNRTKHRCMSWPLRCIDSNHLFLQSCAFSHTIHSGHCIFHSKYQHPYHLLCTNANEQEGILSRFRFAVQLKSLPLSLELVVHPGALHRWAAIRKGHPPLPIQFLTKSK